MPLNFVAPDAVVWPELLDWDGTAIDPGILSKRSGGILHSWILRTYYQLRLAGYDVSRSQSLRPDAINFVAGRDFGRKNRRANCFTVVCQGDAHTSRLADFRIIQNGLQDESDVTATIWHWPQPGIVARDPARGDTLATLAYKGRLLNLDPAFQSDDFMQALAERGVAFDIDAYNGLRGDHTWNEYADADAVLAVRNLTVYDARKKPASKLVNAWFADTPALLGPEPPFEELRRSELDYIEVRTAADAIAAIEALQANPDRYRAMIENGRKRRADFTDEALTTLWVKTIEGPVMAAYQAWRTSSSVSRHLRAFAGMIHEKKAKTSDYKNAFDGPRLLDGPKDKGSLT